jgi:hypothetical protein
MGEFRGSRGIDGLEDTVNGAVRGQQVIGTTYQVLITNSVHIDR